MTFERRALGLDDLKAIIERAGHMQLGAPEQEKLVGAIDTLALLTQELEAKGASIVRLRTLLFGARTGRSWSWRMPTWGWVSVVAVLVVFTAVRNLPGVTFLPSGLG